MGRIEVGVAATMLSGQSETGDQYVVKEFPRGVLISVVDGLGHGSAAAAAARLACSVMDAHSEEPVVSLVRRCHRALHGTRGAVMSLASFDAAESTLTWIGVGDVQGILLRSDPDRAPAYESLLLRRGVVGAQLSELAAAKLAVDAGDMLLFLTDGIEPGADWRAELRSGTAPQAAAERILGRHARGSDDGLVLVARYKGGGP
ncbi:MAG: SpoIIE family protein phosphatase [Anaerolineales bacterium]